MAFKKTFVLSDESINTYGFWVRTDGIVLDNAKNNCPAYFNHKTWEVPLGHWENLTKKDGKLFGTLVIEGGNDLERDYIRKIENGDIKAASIGFDPINWNSDSTNLKQGQTGAAAWDCELFEASLAPLAGNKNALALKSADGFVTLSENNKQNLIPEIKNDNMKRVAIQLGLNEAATEDAICEALKAVQLSAKNADAMQKIVEDHVAKDLPADKKAFFGQLAKTDLNNAMQFLNLNKEVPATVETKPAETTEEVVETTTAVVKDVKVSELIKKSGAPVAADGKDSYDYLQKKNSVELARIKKEDPEKFAALQKGYAEGVRYKA